LLIAGNYIETPCLLVGINKSTFYKWLKKADESTRSTKYSKFRDAVTKAKAIAEAQDVAILAKHAETNWKAVIRMLERKYPNKWGKPKFRSGTSR
jgi:transposase-like protein